MSPPYPKSYRVQVPIQLKLCFSVYGIMHTAWAKYSLFKSSDPRPECLSLGEVFRTAAALTAGRHKLGERSTFSSQNLSHENCKGPKYLHIYRVSSLSNSGAAITVLGRCQVPAPLGKEFLEQTRALNRMQGQHAISCPGAWLSAGLCWEMPHIYRSQQICGRPNIDP